MPWHKTETQEGTLRSMALVSTFWGTGRWSLLLLVSLSLEEEEESCSHITRCLKKDREEIVIDIKKKRYYWSKSITWRIIILEPNLPKSWELGCESEQYALFGYRALLLTFMFALTNLCCSVALWILLSEGSGWSLATLPLSFSSVLSLHGQQTGRRIYLFALQPFCTPPHHPGVFAVTIKPSVVDSESFVIWLYHSLHQETKSISPPLTGPVFVNKTW